MTTTLTLSERVQRIADDHLHNNRPAHPVRVVGCPWCITDVREEAASEMLRHLHPDDWPMLSSHTARFVLAADDLRAWDAREARAGW